MPEEKKKDAHPDGQTKTRRVAGVPCFDIPERTPEEIQDRLVRNLPWLLGRLEWIAFCSPNVFAAKSAVLDLMNFAGLHLTSKSIQVQRKEKLTPKSEKALVEKLRKEFARWLEHHKPEELPEEIREGIQRAITDGTPAIDAEIVGPAGAEKQG